MSAVRAIIKGRVQGVGYRHWTVRTAYSFKLNGWVRNRADGTVEALFSGDEKSITDMLTACQRGPLAARVDGIEQFSAEETDEAFSEKPTV